MENITLLVLVILNIVQLYLGFVERDRLQDRIMAKNLPEYKDNVKVEPNQIELKDDGTMELEDAKDEILNEDAEN